MSGGLGQLGIAGGSNGLGVGEFCNSGGLGLGDLPVTGAGFGVLGAGMGLDGSGGLGVGGGGGAGMGCFLVPLVACRWDMYQSFMHVHA